MKKITSLLMMVVAFLFATTVRAQVDPGVKTDCSVAYAITNMRGSLLMEDNNRFVTRVHGGTQCTLEQVKADKHLQWAFYSDGTNTYLVNVASGEVVVKGGNHIFRSFQQGDNKDIAKVTFKASTKSGNEGNHEVYKYVVNVGGEDIHMRNHDDSEHGVMYYNGHPDDQGSQYKIEVVEGVDLTGLKEKVIAHFGGEFALNVGKTITNISELANNKVYHIKNIDNRGNFIYHTSSNEKLSADKKVAIQSWINAEFALLKSAKNNYYMYNLAADRFVGCPSQDGQSAVALESSPIHPVTIEPNGENVFNFKSNDVYFGISNSYHNGCIVWNAKDDGGNKFNIIEPTYPWTLAPELTLTPKLRLIDVYEYIHSDLQQPYQMLNEIKWTAEAIKLAAADAEGVAGVISSNAPHNGSSDNAGVGALLDDKTDTYFHSRYSGDAVNEPHNLVVDLKKPVSVFSFAYNRRTQNGNNRPTKMRISGKTTEGNWESIVVLSTNSITPLMGADPYVSDKIVANKPYNSLKFEVLETNTGAKFGSFPFFTMSEFDLFSYTATVEHPAGLQKFLDLQKAVVVTNANVVEEFINGTKSYQDLMSAHVALEQLCGDIAAGPMLAELESMKGNCQQVPALNQYPLSAYNEAYAVLTSNATLNEKLVALDKFKASLNSPVYMILSASTKPYCQGVGAYWSGEEWKFKTAIKHDKSVWFKAFGHASEAIGEGTFNFVHYNSGKSLKDNNAIKVEQIPNNVGAFNLRISQGTGETAGCLHCQESGSKLVEWGNATGLDHASAWKFEFVGSSYELSKLSDEVLAKAVELQTVVNAQKGLTINFGSAYGQYQGSQEEYVKNIAAAEAMLNGDMAALTAEGLQAAKASLDLHYNLPKDGAFLRIKASKDNKGAASPYLVSENSTNKQNRAAFVSGVGAEAKSIFYYTGGKLVAYNTGLRVANSTEGRGFAYFNDVTEGASFTFKAAQNGEASAYNVVYNGNRHLYVKQEGEAENIYYYADAADNGNGAGYNFFLEEVTELPVNLSSDSKNNGAYATIYTPVALKLTDDVEAFKGSRRGADVVLTKINGNVIPANSAVVLKTAANAVKNLAITSEVAIENNEGNVFQGAAATTACGENEFYAMGKKNNVIAFYTVAGGKYKGFRAVLPKTAASQSNELRMVFGDVTGIEGVETESLDNAVIYDLSGRRVAAPTKGLYIVNGKKVYFK